MTKPRVLFVCLGNICRSPLAEAAFRRAASDAGLDADTDSAGTAAYHVGNPPDPRSIAEAAKHGIDISGYRARQIETADFTHFTHIVALDHTNLAAITRSRPKAAPAHLSLVLDWTLDREGQSVEDPYYGGDDGFRRAWSEVEHGSQGLVQALLAGARDQAS